MNRKQQILHNRMWASHLVYHETSAQRNSLLKYVDGTLLFVAADVTYVYQNLLTMTGMTSQSLAYTGWRGYVRTAITRELTRDL